MTHEHGLCDITKDLSVLVFLDIDGVLNTHEWDAPACTYPICREHVERLNTLLLHTGASLVLTSTWRLMIHDGDMTLTGMDRLLRSHGLIAGRLAGITRDDCPRASWSGTPDNYIPTTERGAQITDWPERHTSGHAAYVVLDDKDLGITGAGHPFLRTDERVGLTDEDVDTSRWLLVAQMVGLALAHPCGVGEDTGYAPVSPFRMPVEIEPDSRVPDVQSVTK